MHQPPMSHPAYMIPACISLDEAGADAALMQWVGQFTHLENAIWGAATKRRLYTAITQAVDDQADPLLPLKERCSETRNKALSEALAQLKSEGVPHALLTQILQETREGLAPGESFWTAEHDQLQHQLQTYLNTPPTFTLDNNLLNDVLDQGRLSVGDGDRPHLGALWEKLADLSWRLGTPQLIFKTTCVEWGVPTGQSPQTPAVLEIQTFLKKDGTTDLLRLKKEIQKCVLGAPVLRIEGVPEGIVQLGLEGESKAAEAWIAAVTAFVSAETAQHAADRPGHVPTLFEDDTPYWRARIAVLKGENAALTALETLPIPLSPSACPDKTLWAAATEALEDVMASAPRSQIPVILGPLKNMAPEQAIALYAAAEPFVTGRSDALLTLPADCTPQDIQRWIMLAWTMGLKGCRIQRKDALTSLAAGLEAIRTPRPLTRVAPPAPNVMVEKVVERVIHGTPRRPLPPRRKGYTQKAVVGGQKIYLRTGEYENGDLGEIFVSMHKEGAAFRGLMNCFAMAVSIGLQYGVPLREFVEAFIFTRFEPAGEVKGNDAIKTATSIIDYLFRELGVSYLGRKDLAHVDLKESLPDLLAGRGAETTYGGKTPVESTTSTGYVRSNLYILKPGARNEPNTKPLNQNQEGTESKPTPDDILE